MSDTPAKSAEQPGEPAPTDNTIALKTATDDAKDRERQFRLEQVELLEQSKRAVAERQRANAATIAQQRLELGRDRLAEQRADRERKVGAQEWREKVRAEDAAAKKAKQKGQGFADIIKLPSDQHESKLAELAKKLDEDVASLSEGFAEYAATETSSSAASESEWGDDAPWAEPVTTAAVLEALIARINTHIKAQPHRVLVIALWVMMAWVHEEVANSSTYLVATSPGKGQGKTTLIVKVVGRLVPKPYVSGSDPTVSSIFRTADRERPTQIFDNVDKLFQRKPDVCDLFLYGSTRGVKVPRSERIGGQWQTVWYDPFCPKACSLIGTNLPEPLIDRSLLIELWPLKLGEKVVEVNPFDQDLMAEFKTLRSKLARWRDDHADGLKRAKPLKPAAFIGRPADNWTLLWAIGELAGDAWAEKARKAAEQLAKDELVEPSWLELLLKELWDVFVKEKRKSITSSQLVARLTADPASPWYEYGRGRGHRVTQWEVAALLRRKVRVRPRLVGKKRVGGYHLADFLEKQIFEHFLPHNSLTLSPGTKKKSGRSRRKKKSGGRSRSERGRES